MIDRRLFGSLALGAAAGLALPRAAFAGAAPNGGLYRQPWLVASCLDLTKDLAAADGAGRGFAVMWEQRDCPYCRDTHLINFADPATVGYVRSNFDVLQLDLRGVREVIDFDGEQMEERRLARKHAIAGTPTFQFFVPAGRSGRTEALRVDTYLKPPAFQAMFRFVRENAWHEHDFRAWLKSQGLAG
ncbi:MAG TPA: thioredoxin family protein [Arenibaculum sp.]|nr:thioredoxin family protein [Arenibaculum sp.]